MYPVPGPMGALVKFAYNGMGVFVATCRGNGDYKEDNIFMSRSTDVGRTWSSCKRPIASSSQPWDALSGDEYGTFVAITSSPTYDPTSMTWTNIPGELRSMRSTDAGITWKKYATCNDNHGWFVITNGGGVYVALAGPNGNPAYNTMRSTDRGQTWTCHSPPNGVQFSYSTSITYGNGIFVATTSDGAMHSTDGGVSWTAYKSNDGKVWGSITYGNGVFVALTNADGSVNRTMSSTDGITWTGLPGAPYDARWDSVAYGGGKFLALGRSKDDFDDGSTSGYRRADIKMMTHPGDTF